MHVPRLRDVLWRRLAPLAPLLAALGCSAADPADSNTASALRLPPRTTFPLGLVTGSIYQDVNESLDHDSFRVMCEYAELGVKWIRIEADVPGVSAATYQTIVKAAHAHNIQVAVVVPTSFCRATQATCGEDDSLSCYVFDYVATLDRLVTSVFSDASGARVDAFEIGNEPNVGDPAQCDASNAMAAADFVTLLRGAWAWKLDHARQELIISGGLRDTHTEDPYWTQLVAALQADEGTPFDELGVHPFDLDSYQESPCSLSGAADGLPCWQSHVTADLARIYKLVQKPVFITAFGWQDLAIQVDGMKAAVQAFAASHAVDAALWTSYRDDGASPDSFGLRGSWDQSYTPPQYPPKPSWNEFYALAHGASGTTPDPNQCWAPTPNATCHPVTPPRPAICCDANITTDCLPPGTGSLFTPGTYCGEIRIPNPRCKPPDLCWEEVCGIVGESCNVDVTCGPEDMSSCDILDETPKTPLCGPGQPVGTFGCSNNYCGDLVCDPFEDSVNCPSDCPWQDGDGMCGPDEPSYTSDCYFCHGS